jgi:hypothetical protein
MGNSIDIACCKNKNINDKAMETNSIKMDTFKPQDENVHKILQQLDS